MASSSLPSSLLRRIFALDDNNVNLGVELTRIRRGQEEVVVLLTDIAALLKEILEAQK